MEWIIDNSETTVEFSVKKFWGMVTVKGRMQMQQGKLELNPANPEQRSVYVEINAGSVVTGNSRRDAHLKSADFFDVERYPVIIFQSRSVEQVDQTHLRLNGELTIRGITKPITLEVIETNNSGSLQFTATATLMRGDFGLSFSKIPISREVALNIQVKALKSAVELHSLNTK